MKQMFFLIMLGMMGSNAIAQTELKDSLPKDANFYDYVRFINKISPKEDLSQKTEQEREAILEGSHTAYVNKTAMLWEDRLAPWGDCRVAGYAMNKYFIDFNKKRLSGERPLASSLPLSTTLFYAKQPLKTTPTR